MGQSPLITESLWWGSTESVVWFMLTYWGLIWARLQPHGSICSGSEVRMSWNKINRLSGWRPGMMVNWWNCPCWMSWLDHFNLYRKHSKRFCSASYDKNYMTTCYAKNIFLLGLFLWIIDAVAVYFNIRNMIWSLIFRFSVVLCNVKLKCLQPNGSVYELHTVCCE